MAVAGAGDRGRAAAATPAGPKKLRFALIPKALDIPVFDYANKGAQREAAALGDVEVIYRGPDHADELKQKEVLESFITQKVDGIAISVLNAEFLTSTIDKADRRRHSGRHLGLGRAGVEAHRVLRRRRLQVRPGSWARQAAKLLNGKGTVAFITSLGANNLRAPARRRRRTRSRSIPGIKIVETYDMQGRQRALRGDDRDRHESLSGPRRVDFGRRLAGVHAERARAGAADDEGHLVRHESAGARPAQGRQGRRCCIGQKYFGWGSETVQLLYDIVHGKRPANAIIDSGVDVVTTENVDAVRRGVEEAGGRGVVALPPRPAAARLLPGGDGGQQRMALGTKRVDDRDAAPGEAFLKIFGQQQPAPRVGGRGENHRVPAAPADVSARGPSPQAGRRLTSRSAERHRPS